MPPVVRLTALFAATALTFATAACGDDSSDESTGDREAIDKSAVEETTESTTDLTDLAGRTLVVTDIRVGDETRDVAEDSQIRLRFSDSDVHVETGCNGLGGTWERKGDTLKIGQLMGTMMACEEPLMEQEQWIRTLLEEPLTVTDDTFVAGETVLTLADREKVSPDLEFIGQRWMLNALMADSMLNPAPRGVKAWVEFDGAELRVNTGCNAGAGPAEFDGETLTLPEGLTLTERGCEGEAAEVEERMLAVLTDEVAVDIQEGAMSLTGANDESLLFGTKIL